MHRLALLPVFLLLLAACTDTPASTPVIDEPTTEVVVEEETVAATVNGVEIPMSRVQRLHPFRPDSVPSEVLTGLLRDVIIQEIVVQAASAEFGIVVEEADVEAAYQEIRQVIEEEQGGYEAYLVTQNRTDDAVREVAFQSLVWERVRNALADDELEPLTEEELQRQYDIQLPSLTQICLSRIILETRADAIAALDRISAGEDFAAVAAEVSVQSEEAEAGGDLGCVSPVAFPEELAEALLSAPVGEPTGPIEAQGGFHVFVVSSSFVPTLEEATPLIEAGRFTEASLLFSGWLQRLVGSAEVSVAPEFGTWTLVPVPGVAPPTG
ncbi:MAG: peptidylprolyl isomerase [Acidimicrobiia bacterium]